MMMNKKTIQQPTIGDITKKIFDVIKGECSREEVCLWAINYIKKDSFISISDLNAWHYLVAISNIDELTGSNEYLYDTDDILKLVNEYSNLQDRL